MQTSGEIILDVYNSNYKTDFKRDKSPVTAADILSHEHITKNLKQWFPHIPIISEEGHISPYEKRKSYEYVWLLDPLDGTKEFIEKTDEFTINLALIHKNKPIAGFIYLPAQKEFYYAITGQGSFQLFDDFTTKRLNCSTFSLRQPRLRVVTSRRVLDHQTKKIIETLNDPVIIQLGSALKFISIAKGETDFYPRMIHIMEWDTAAGQIIIEEAGGVFMDVQTKLPLMYNKASLTNPYFVASGKYVAHVYSL